MILTSHTGPAPAFTRDIFPSHAAYATRISRPYHILRSSGHPFEHRLPAILAHTTHSPHDSPLLYLEWDVRVADDAPDILPLLGTAELLLPAHINLPHAQWLQDRTPGLQIPWHIIGIMLGTREAFREIHRRFPECRAAAANLPTPAARYEGAILLAIQKSGIALAPLPPRLHQFARHHRNAPFLHFEGDTKKKLKGRKPVMLSHL